VRETALKQATVSAPISDRYQVTCYGGAIDLVHFLCLAAEVCAGEGMRPRLHKEWVREGGPDHLHGFNFQRPPEAHPDDLPSNALGALFGWEMRAQQQDLSIDLLAAMKVFLAPLVPVPDAVAKQFSHRQIVMGFEKGKPSRSLIAERYGWFTARRMRATEHGGPKNAWQAAMRARQGR
jgi:hypothetical protein